MVIVPLRRPTRLPTAADECWSLIVLGACKNVSTLRLPKLRARASIGFSSYEMTRAIVRSILNFLQRIDQKLNLMFWVLIIAQSDGMRPNLDF
jgi:hypothetical protein